MDEKIDYKLIGNCVREERLKYNLTQEKLAESVGISASYMGLLERGERILSVETLVRLSIALNVSTDTLLKATLDSVERDTFSLQFALLTNGLDDPQKQMVLDVVKAMLPHFKQEQHNNE
ncbi:helix-turn-helix domain-containing protein [Paenibacillus sp. RS8]|uniref:helix-turn-helix domain-containing protein n=1 Tax=Paenibacillus sp. RS8 TaxID=3242681 RepID=UPI0035BF69CE